MDMKVEKDQLNIKQNRPSRDEAMEAVKTLISWAGDDPQRGFNRNSKRVVKAYEEFLQAIVKTHLQH